MAKRHWHFYAILGTLILSTGCTSYDTVAVIPDSTTAPQFYAPKLEDEYRLQVGDEVSIKSYYDPQLNQEILVRTDGRVSLLLMGDVLVAGMTPAELDTIITNRYSKVIDSPEVTVIVKKSAGLSVYLGGEVKSPSMQKLDGPLTVLQSITLAGGVLPTANMNQVLLLRRQKNGNFNVYRMDLNKVLKNESADVFLQRQDVVYVPKTAIADIGIFVDQYINKIIPDAVVLSYGWIKNKNPSVELVR